MIIEEHISGSVTFRNGTSVPLSDSTVIGVSVKKQCCPDGKFEIGGVYAASLSMTCQIPGTNSFSLRGAKIILNSKFQNEANFQPRGIFWVTDAKKLSGDIYSITGMDAVGWLDSSSMNYTDAQNRIFDSVADYFAAQASLYYLQDWCAVLTSFTDSIVSRMTGTSGILSWKHYDSDQNGHFRNQYIWTNINGEEVELDGQDGRECREPSYFIYIENGAGSSDCPRDLFRALASIACGFIYAGTDGKLTLGQFGQPDFGTATITPDCIEADSLEIADFQLALLSSSVQSDVFDGAANMQIYTDLSDYLIYAPFRNAISSNPFVDGFTQQHVNPDRSDDGLRNLWTLAKGLWVSGLHPRPFRCKVHKAERFQPGQAVRILPPGGDNFLDSIITSVTWTFRGGCTLSCSGEDSRTMTDALRMSKADKAIKEARNRCYALEKKISG